MDADRVEGEGNRGDGCQNTPPPPSPSLMGERVLAATAGCLTVPAWSLKGYVRISVSVFTGGILHMNIYWARSIYDRKVMPLTSLNATLCCVATSGAEYDRPSRPKLGQLDDVPLFRGCKKMRQATPHTTRFRVGEVAS